MGIIHPKRACSHCCTKLRNKCLVCTLTIGINSNNGENCGNWKESLSYAQHGCPKKFCNNKELLVHEKECRFSPCYCPAPNCNYMGVYKDLNCPYYANHKDKWNQFSFSNSTRARLSMTPSAPGAGEFSYDIFCLTEGNAMTFGSSKMNMIQKVSFQTPKDFMLVPNYS
ncbi:hypothetical protein ARALYDRAFT_894337 [Arabidopsis lyrata subsp. lyrata]|uniref:SIAH-type domain-containing protein n=1 Tax=Arabidopsis lyrata subsp. lyrata TaxID=81972 RepID=D7KU99_ARALL|nr:hypothetical protein ARALYDRAFT_894337 [Arabidopsis lyrata subsp. lyrata]